MTYKICISTLRVTVVADVVLIKYIHEGIWAYV